MNPLHSIERWKPVEAPIRNFEGQRAPEKLLAVVAQFEVESNPRYRAGDGQTHCNCFSWDVTRALGCEIPHWVDRATRLPCPVGQGEELNCNKTLPWLEDARLNHGWSETDEARAAEHASLGGPAVVIWRNELGGPGHIAVLLPSSGGKTMIAQAGKHNYFGVPLAKFGSVQPLRFFVHA